MKIRTIGILSLVGVSISITPALAGPVGVQRSTPYYQRTAVTAQLQAAQDQEWRNAQLSHAKGPLLVRYMDKSAQLQELINQIQSGQAVSADEIDEALQPTVR